MAPGCSLAGKAPGWSPTLRVEDSERGPLRKIMYYVYLLQSEKDGSYYIGQTNNLETRFLKHNSGKVKSTKNKIPYKLVKYEFFQTRNEARWHEYTLKHNTYQRKKFYGV